MRSDKDCATELQFVAFITFAWASCYLHLLYFHLKPCLRFSYLILHPFFTPFSFLLQTFLSSPTFRSLYALSIRAMSEGQYCYRWPRPSATVDNIIFSSKDQELHLLLIKRAHGPFEGMWALPGGFVDANESLIDAAARELVEETSVTGVDLVEVGSFGDPGRDPRGHTISIGFASYIDPALLEGGQVQVEAGDDAAEAQWFPLASLPPLAFDHAKIIRRAWQALDAQVGGEEEGKEGEGLISLTLVDKVTGKVLGENIAVGSLPSLSYLDDA